MNHSPEPFDLQMLQQRFTDEFGDNQIPPSVFHAPGRVNLIGEHTDYTGGIVFPCAIDRGNLLLIRRTNSDQYRFASTNFDFQTTLTADELGQPKEDHWVNYPLGVIDQLKQRGAKLSGFDCLFAGNVPNGAGLSSSAAIEVVTAFALNELFDLGIDRVSLAVLSQAAENEFVGMQCGIMDQFAVTMGKANHAMMLNCSTLEYEYVPLVLNDHAIVLANTNQRRELAESAYNDRVAECKRALGYLQTQMTVEALGEITESDLESAKASFGDDDVAYARARHIASENARVRSAVEALTNGDLPRFGELMQASHASLRDDFAVSSEPLDTLVSLAIAQDGVLGARLTGAGFGGCTVNLMHEDAVEQFQANVGAAYHSKTGLKADFYVIKPSDGVMEHRL